MTDNFITIGELDLVNILEDHYKLLIDDSTNGDTKAALVSVLRNYLIESVTPNINPTTKTWYIGSIDTGISVTGIEFRYNHPNIEYKISGTDEWIYIFDITVLMPTIEIDNETLCWMVNGVLTDKSAVNARINSMNGNVSIVGADGILIKNDTEMNTITISRADTNDNGIPPADIPSKVIRASDGKLIIKWTDPADLTADGVTYSLWDHTTLVRKIGSYPVDETDGDILVINHIRNQYSENGYVDAGLINGIKYYYKLFIYSADGIINRNPKNNMIGIPKKYFIYGVKIDETNSNPETAVTYTDDAVGMTGGSSDWDLLPIYANIQPCLLKNGSVQYYLKKDNYNYKANGVDLSDITSGNDGDVMVEFPKIAYMIYREDNYLYVKITDDPAAKLADERFCFYAHTREAEGDRENLYIGAYGGSLLNSSIRSISGSTWKTSQTLTSFRTLAQANGSGYDILSYYPLVLLQCLYLIKYKNLNSQSAVGNGQTINATGTLDESGFTYGIPNTNGKIKLFGLEDLWGGYHEYIDGIKTDSQRQIMIGFDQFNDNGNGYKTYNVGYSININYYMTKTLGHSKYGFLPKEGGGSTTTFFSDAIAISSNAFYIIGYSGDAYGIFYTRMNYGGGGYSNIGCRLMYL